MINLYSWKDNPLKVVKDPQNPNPKINLYLLETGNELINPNKKQPIALTIKIWSICHRNMAPGIAPIEINKKLFFKRNFSIYCLTSKKPNATATTPKAKEIINTFIALEKLDCENNSNKS